MKQKIITFGSTGRAASVKTRTAAADGRKKRRKRRTGRQALHYLLLLLTSAAILTILSLTVFFKIEKLEVTGNTKYADEEILAQSGVKLQDNLFRVSQKRVQAALMKKFPYIEGVKLKRSFPPKLTLEILQAQPLGAVAAPNGYVVIGRSGKVLETGARTPPENVTVVNGMYLSLAQVGHQLGELIDKGELTYPPEVLAEIETLRKDKANKGRADSADRESEWRKQAAQSEEENFKMLLYLVEAVEETGFGKISLVDFSDRLNMRLVYDNRVLIELGSEADLSYKLKFVQKLISDKLPADYQGRLDASTASSSGQVWELAEDISGELAKMRPEIAVDEEKHTSEKTGNASVEDNPDLAVEASESGQESSSETVPSSEAQAASSSETAKNEPQWTSFNQPDDLAVIPSNSPSNTSDSVT